MMTLRKSLRDRLAAIAGVASCRIVLEENITPEDCPLIRVVPSRTFDDERNANGRVRLEKLYAAVFDLESRIEQLLLASGALYRETILDEDRLETYKLMAIRCEVRVRRPCAAD
jgi:hypothetical protein